ncbi:MAG TPA: hypothetical protein VF881_07280, partial [Polyangiaceae bacterium]
MQLNARSLVALVIITGFMVLVIFLTKALDMGAYAGIAGVIGAIIGVWYAGSAPATGVATDALTDAVRRATQGEPPALPQG